MAETPPPPGRNSAYGFETLAVHAGASPDPTTGARSTPIYQTTAYVFDDVDHAASLFNLQSYGYIYSRLNNPTTSVLEERLASLEGGRGAICTATGHAAQMLAFFAFMEPGDHFVASNKLYGGSITQFGRSFKKFGWECTFVDPDDPENFRRALTPRSKAVFIESLANPGGVITDIEAIARSRTRRARSSSSTIRWRRPISAGRSNGAPISSSIRRQSSSRATATRWAAWSSTAASSTGRRTTSSRP